MADLNVRPAVYAAARLSESEKRRLDIAWPDAVLPQDDDGVDETGCQRRASHGVHITLWLVAGTTSATEDPDIFRVAQQMVQAVAPQTTMRVLGMTCSPTVKSHCAATQSSFWCGSPSGIVEFRRPSSRRGASGQAGQCKPRCTLLSLRPIVLTSCGSFQNQSRHAAQTKQRKLKAPPVIHPQTKQCPSPQ